MIDWEALYNKVCTDEEMWDHLHHIIPRYCRTGNSEIVRLSKRRHVLAHYIRYRWLKHRSDRMAVQVMTHKRLPVIEGEIDIRNPYKKKKVKKMKEVKEAKKKPTIPVIYKEKKTNKKFDYNKMKKYYESLGMIEFFYATWGEG